MSPEDALQAQLDILSRRIDALSNSLASFIARLDRLEFVADLQRLDPLDADPGDPPESDQERYDREHGVTGGSYTARRLERD